MIYPVTTIPVALYMLQGYFRGLPGEIEEETRVARLAAGIDLPQPVWDSIGEVAAELGVAMPTLE